MAFCFALATIFAMWPALTNGQPFFFPDTTAYVRGADLAIARVVGERFATDWAKDERRTVEIKSAVEPSDRKAKPVQRPVLAGRSLIYGALLYLGALTGRMWLAIFLQSVIAVYLTYLFVTRTLGLDFRCFLVACGLLCLATSLPFYVSFLMPDVFAGFLILGFSILATTWDALSHPERAATIAILLFAVLAHATHVMVLALLTALVAAYVLLLSRRCRPSVPDSLV